MTTTPPVPGEALSADDIVALSYEESLAQLEHLIARLEAGRVELAEALQCYERGVRLAEHCSELLDRTEQTVTQLVAGAGRLREQSFAEAPSPPRAAAAAPGAPARPVAPSGDLTSWRGLEPAPARAAPLPVDDDDIPF